jgi:hypothetical protein
VNGVRSNNPGPPIPRGFSTSRVTKVNRAVLWSSMGTNTPWRVLKGRAATTVKKG